MSKRTSSRKKSDKSFTSNVFLRKLDPDVAMTGFKSVEEETKKSNRR